MKLWPSRSTSNKAGVIATALLTLLTPLFLILGPVPIAHAASDVSSSDVTINEADGTATFTFTLNGSTDTQYTYQTVDGSAIAPDDYTATSGTLQFNTQTTDLPTATVTVPITDDQTPESTESFSLEVYANIDGPVLDNTWTATILDDDSEVVPPQGPTVTSSDVTINEADGTATFTFTLNGSTENQYTYQTVDGSAVAPDDYTATSGTLQFSTDTTDLPTATVTVPITNDTIPESTESFTIEVYSNIDGPSLEDTWTATILDDDSEVVPPQNPTITSQDVTVNEGKGTATLTFAIDSFPESDYTYQTVDGSATAPADYTTTTGTLQFDNNDSRQHFATVTIPITNDTIPESTESFSIEVYSNIDGPVLEGTWTVTILDDDTVVVTPPTDTPPPVSPPVIPPVTPPTVPPVVPPLTPPTTVPVTPLDTTPVTTPTTTTTPSPTTTPTPAPVPTPAPTPITAATTSTTNPRVDAAADVTFAAETPTAPEVLSVTTPSQAAVTVLPHPVLPAAAPLAGPYRSAFVRSVPDPTQLSRSAKTIITSLLLAALLILLIAFPADLFNSTLAANYDEIAGWFKIGKLHNVANTLRKTPTPIAIGGFALIGALLNSQLSPDFGWNKASLALLLGMLITIIIAALLYDISRAIYLKQRYAVKSKLRIHVLGLGTGGVLVAASRLSHFLPGYFYGMFTALVYGDETPDKQDGEGLAISSVLLLVIATAGWFAWIPVKHAAIKPGAGLPILVLDATLSSLWVSALSAIVFALAPLRFFYGEQVKKWSGKGWLVIYGLGMSLFVYTILHPGQNFYGTSGKTTLRSVLTLFIGFGLFSLIFWAYFRYRPARWQTVKKSA